MLDAWLLLVPTLGFIFGMYLLGAGVQNGLLALGQQLALRELCDEHLDTVDGDATISEEAPGEDHPSNFGRR